MKAARTPRLALGRAWWELRGVIALYESSVDDSKGDKGAKDGISVDASSARRGGQLRHVFSLRYSSAQQVGSLMHAVKAAIDMLCRLRCEFSATLQQSTLKPMLCAHFTGLLSLGHPPSPPSSDCASYHRISRIILEHFPRKPLKHLLICPPVARIDQSREECHVCLGEMRSMMRDADKERGRPSDVRRRDARHAIGQQRIGGRYQCSVLG